MSTRAAVLALLAPALLAPAAATAARSPAENLARARELVDAERPEEALELLERIPRGAPQEPALLLLRGTARLMVGETEAGRRDLDRSLELDPAQRQAWLNRGALALSEERYDAALADFTRAEELAPEAPDNHLNIGAVLLLAGRLPEAGRRFRRYLEGPGRSAEGYYLVASNYAAAGEATLAVEHLRRAVELDERARLRARTDPNFLALSGTEAYDSLMTGDPRPPPPGAYVARRLYPTPYEGGDGRLLAAVVDALQLSGVPFDRRVEVTPAWALIWGDLRIVVRTAPDGKGLVEASAPAERFSADDWRQRTDELFRRVHARLLASG